MTDIQQYSKQVPAFHGPPIIALDDVESAELETLRERKRLDDRHREMIRLQATASRTFGSTGVAVVCSASITDLEALCRVSDGLPTNKAGRAVFRTYQAFGGRVPWETAGEPAIDARKVGTMERLTAPSTSVLDTMIAELVGVPRFTHKDELLTAARQVRDDVQRYVALLFDALIESETLVPYQPETLSKDRLNSVIGTWVSAHNMFTPADTWFSVQMLYCSKVSEPQVAVVRLEFERLETFCATVAARLEYQVLKLRYADDVEGGWLKKRKLQKAQADRTLSYVNAVAASIAEVDAADTDATSADRLMEVLHRRQAHQALVCARTA